MIQVRQDPEHGDVVLEVSGVLDLRMAGEVASIAWEQPHGLHLVIDLSHASDIEDVALGRLVVGLPTTRPRTVRGARQHQAKLLRYLGENLEDDVVELGHTD